jgi:hypothetical protein
MNQASDVDVDAPIELDGEVDLLLGRVVVGREVINLVRSNALDHREHLGSVPQIDGSLRNVVEQVAGDGPDVEAEDGSVLCESLKEEAPVLPRAADDDGPPHVLG